MIMLAMGNNPQGVHDMLQENGFRLVELADYPFMKVEKEGKKHGRR
jgi:uncharacterized membrane-anchored protein